MRELKLNTLGRYGKNASNLVLEEHSHCEVPAGCGGVVLRWRNPDDGLPFLLRIFTTHTCQVFLDGIVPPSTRSMIPFGPHVFSLIVSDLPAGAAAFAFAAIHDETEVSSRPRVSPPSRRRTAILTAADGRWKYTTTAPADDTWMRADFDDSGWPAMTQRPAPVFDQKDPQRYRLDSMLKTGAVCLGVEGPAARIWVRRSFHLVSARPPEPGKS